jgi:hypothetical protein
MEVSRKHHSGIGAPSYNHQDIDDFSWENSDILWEETSKGGL